MSASHFIACEWSLLQQWRTVNNQVSYLRGALEYSRGAEATFTGQLLLFLFVDHSLFIRYTVLDREIQETMQNEDF
jgi:hypothetical protein